MSAHRVLVTAVLLLLTIPSFALAGKPLGTLTAPYDSLEVYGCYRPKCTMTADPETGTFELSDEVQGYYGTSNTGATIEATHQLERPVERILATARIQLDATTSASGENGSAIAGVDIELRRWASDQTTWLRVVDGLEGVCEYCQDRAPDTRQGLIELPLELFMEDGTEIPPGPINFRLQVSGFAEVSAPSRPSSRPDLYVHVEDEPQVETTPGVNPTDPQVVVHVEHSALPEIQAGTAEAPEDPTPPSAAYAVRATLVEITLEEIPRPAEVLSKTPPGHIRENKTYSFEAPYVLTYNHTSCGNEERCQPSGVDPETGRFDVTMRSAKGYDYSEMGLLRFAELPYAAESLNITMRLRIDSAHAETRGVFADGVAYLEALASAAHHECAFYECRNDTWTVIVHADPAYGPASRTAEVLELSFTVLPPPGEVMPPGTIAFAWTLYGWISSSDGHLAATGIPFAEVGLNATLEGVTVELDPAPWP